MIFGLNKYSELTLVFIGGIVLYIIIKAPWWAYAVLTVFYIGILLSFISKEQQEKKQ